MTRAPNDRIARQSTRSLRVLFFALRTLPSPTPTMTLT